MVAAFSFDLAELAWGRGAGGKGGISARRFCSAGPDNVPQFKRLCHPLPTSVGPLSPSPSPPKQAFESRSTELAGEQVIQYQTCFKRACFEDEGSQIFFTYSFRVPRGGATRGEALRHRCPSIAIRVRDIARSRVSPRLVLAGFSASERRSYEGVATRHRCPGTAIRVRVIARSRVSPRLVLAGFSASERRSYEGRSYEGRPDAKGDVQLNF
ncbi:hypothetical protein FF011L_52820 [Roseimaritima multifibrata]|uniref:Uncharacterized protein n=1 Tax=Roseimaritima multifibrata TaxID=1930274 RepID=A0A517MNM2_9BACT|nr:hypothetical protein FF011L_52820 [Roseimaritima multifibrata]